MPIKEILWKSKDLLYKIVQKPFIYVFPNDYKWYLVPGKPRQNIATKKLNLLQKIIATNNFIVLLRRYFWPRWYMVFIIDHNYYLTEMRSISAKKGSHVRMFCHEKSGKRRWTTREQNRETDQKNAAVGRELRPGTRTMGSVASVNKKSAASQFGRNDWIRAVVETTATDYAYGRQSAGVDSARGSSASPTSPPANVSSQKRPSGEIFRNRAWFIAKLKVGETLGEWTTYFDFSFTSKIFKPKIQTFKINQLNAK